MWSLLLPSVSPHRPPHQEPPGACPAKQNSSRLGQFDPYCPALAPSDHKGFLMRRLLTPSVIFLLGTLYFVCLSAVTAIRLLLKELSTVQATPTQATFAVLATWVIPAFATFLLVEGNKPFSMRFANAWRWAAFAEGSLNCPNLPGRISQFRSAKLFNASSKKIDSPRPGHANR